MDKIKILLTTDVPSQQFVSKEFLESQRNTYLVETAASVDVALKKLGDNNYDVLLLEMAHSQRYHLEREWENGFSLSDFNIFEQVAMIAVEVPDVPLVISTVLDDDRVVVCRSTDVYVINNSDYLSKLPATIKDAIGRNKHVLSSEGNEKYHRLFENAPEPILILDLFGKIRDANSVACNVFGYSKEEFLSMSVLDLSSDEHSPRAMELISQIVETGSQTYEVAYKRKDGGLVPLEINAKVIEFDDEKLVQAFARDITHRRERQQEVEEYTLLLSNKATEYETQLQASEKLIKIGELVNIVGHELRNPLSVINHSVYFLKMVMEDVDEKVSEYLKRIEGEIATCNKIIGDLLNYSRKRKLNLQESNINNLLEDVLTKIFFPDGIEVIKHFASDLPLIIADAVELKQVFLNLVMNAIQAMPEGGKLILTTGWKDDYLYVHVEDTGIGIPKENKGKIFVPQFTTKPKGIGLGLAVSKGLIEEHGGRITVESEVGKGTTFTVELPINHK